MIVLAIVLTIVGIIFIPPLLYFTITYIYHLFQIRNYPPGPFPLPIIGNINRVKKRSFESFSELSKQYGDVFSISLGMKRVVVVNTIESAREACITKAEQFSGRVPGSYTRRIMTRGGKNTPGYDYEFMWKFMRKNMVEAMDMFSDSKGKLERLAVEESDYLNERIKEKLDEPIDLHYDFGQYQYLFLSVLIYIYSFLNCYFS